MVTWIGVIEPITVGFQDPFGTLGVPTPINTTPCGIVEWLGSTKFLPTYTSEFIKYLISNHGFIPSNSCNVQFRLLVSQMLVASDGNHSQRKLNSSVLLLWKSHWGDEHSNGDQRIL